MKFKFGITKVFNGLQILKGIIDFVEDFFGDNVSKSEKKKLIIELVDDTINDIEDMTFDFVDNDTVIKMLDKLIDFIYKAIDLKNNLENTFE